MKKILIVLGVFLIISIAASGFVYIKYDEIVTMRAQITTISDSGKYNTSLNDSVNEILVQGSINKAHKKWIKEFIIKEIPKNDYEGSYVHLMRKLRAKNINLTGVQHKSVEKEFLKIKEAANLRKALVSKTNKEYRQMRENKMSVFIEDTLIGEKLKIEDIKYY